MQQKVANQQEALEIAMKLETTPVGDNSGIAQIQAHLVEMDLELRNMKKGSLFEKRFGVHDVRQKVMTKNNVLR